MRSFDRCIPVSVDPARFDPGPDRNVRRLNEELGLTILLTEQNVNFALHLAGDIHILDTGRIRLRGTAAELESNAWVRQAYFGG